MKAYKAPAKINLGLHILGKRPDGYHEIETLMVPIPWFDEITVSEAAELSFSMEGVIGDIDADDNLCLKAAKALQKQTGSNSGASIHLKKDIPIGAGLGGGSSDAATTLKALNRLWETGLNDRELMRVSEEIGSDVPFFIKSKASISTGRGEILEAIDISFIQDAELDLIVAMPQDEFVSTAEAYAGINLSNDKRAPIMNVITEKTMSTWADNISNDFEESVFESHPKIKELKEFLIDSGAVYASMSGSGASVFGFLDPDIELDLGRLHNLTSRNIRVRTLELGF